MLRLLLCCGFLYAGTLPAQAPPPPKPSGGATFSTTSGGSSSAGTTRDKTQGLGDRLRKLLAKNQGLATVATTARDSAPSVPTETPRPDTGDESADTPPRSPLRETLGLDDERSFDVAAGLAYYYLEEGDTEGAEEELFVAALYSAADRQFDVIALIELYSLLAVTYLMDDYEEEADEAFYKAERVADAYFDTYPSDEEAHFVYSELGNIYYELGFYGQAAEQYYAITEISDYDAEAAYRLAASYAMLDEPEAALYYLEQALEGGYQEQEDAVDIPTDPNLEGIRYTDTFAALVEAYELD